MIKNGTHGEYFDADDAGHYYPIPIAFPINQNKNIQKVEEPKYIRNIDLSPNERKQYVGSVIGNKLRSIINKTSTKWMAKTNDTTEKSKTIRPGTTANINARRIYSQTVQKDSLSNKITNPSSASNGSKKSFRHRNQRKNNIRINGFVVQNAWIPNSYRMNRAGDLSNLNTTQCKINEEKLEEAEPTMSNLGKKMQPKKSQIIIAQPVQKRTKYFKSEPRWKKDSDNSESIVTLLSKARLEKYAILEKLGTGSYATVYLARAVNQDNRNVAIKIFDGK